MSDLLASLHEKINAATSRDELDGILQSIWRCYWPGELSDADAQFLADAIENRSRDAACSAQDRWPRLTGGQYRVSRRDNVASAAPMRTAQSVEIAQPTACGLA